MPDYSYSIFKVLCILKKESCVDIRVDIIDKDKSFMSRHVARLIIRWGCVVQVQWVSLNILEGGASVRYKQAIFLPSPSPSPFCRPTDYYHNGGFLSPQFYSITESVSVVLALCCEF